MMEEEYIVSQQGAETNIDFYSSIENDIELRLTVEVDGNTVMKTSHHMSFKEADSFIESLKSQVDEIRHV
jgi:hypothetical protein